MKHLLTGMLKDAATSSLHYCGFRGIRKTGSFAGYCSFEAHSIRTTTQEDQASSEQEVKKNKSLFNGWHLTAEIICRPAYG
jgi:hypothetical protein